MKETMEQTRDRYYRNEFYKGENIPLIEEAIELAKEQGISLKRIQVKRKSDITNDIIGKPVSEVIGYLQTLRQDAILTSYQNDDDYSFDYDEGLNVVFMSVESDYEYGSRIGRLLGKTMRSHIREINKKHADREKRKVKIQKMEAQLAQLKQEDAEDKDE